MITFFYVGHAVGLNSQRFFLSAHIFARGFLTATVILDWLQRNSVHRLALVLFSSGHKSKEGTNCFVKCFRYVDYLLCRTEPQSIDFRLKKVKSS
jgi:hypothetical protein